MSKKDYLAGLAAFALIVTTVITAMFIINIDREKAIKASATSSPTYIPVCTEHSVSLEKVRQQLANTITDGMDNGYVPIGGMSVVYSRTTGYTACQAMRLK